MYNVNGFFKKYCRENEVDLFNVVFVGFGCFGIVYDIIFKVGY